MPLQVNLKVRIAEVNRTLLKKIGVNLLTQDSTGGFQLGIAAGRGHLPADARTRLSAQCGAIIRCPVGSTVSAAGKLFGLDIISSLDLAAD